MGSEFSCVSPGKVLKCRKAKPLAQGHGAQWGPSPDQSRRRRVPVVYKAPSQVLWGTSQKRKLYQPVSVLHHLQPTGHSAKFQRYKQLQEIISTFEKYAV